MGVKSVGLRGIGWMEGRMGLQVVGWSGGGGGLYFYTGGEGTRGEGMRGEGTRGEALQTSMQVVRLQWLCLQGSHVALHPVPKMLDREIWRAANLL